METFFVTYNTGEYDSYHEHVYTIDSESKEALYQEIRNAFDEYVEYQTKYMEERKKVDKFRPETSTADKKEFSKYYTHLSTFYETYPNVADFFVYDCAITPFDETMICKKDEAFVKSGFEIYTMEEYIEIRRPVKKQAL
jgi:hypothetical protein